MKKCCGHCRNWHPKFRTYYSAIYGDCPKKKCLKEYKDKSHWWNCFFRYKENNAKEQMYVEETISLLE